ncbi:hypothetical protein NQ314_017954 [Rhamnusium bicolor]|uniref:Pentatricopeptide repeat-containing protein n=1 Tax=Rhamnusium bicolor TaxID=1586634 RepID=A0AAV8WSJ3_9CUCU|nr:hypothetical protein NQ314_017954 [Rhamnusium bicolor]
MRHYENLRKHYPVLDSFTLENVILALSVTNQWKKCIDLLQEVKITAIPKTLVYSSVISSAFLNNEERLGWKLLEEMLELEKIPHSTTFLSYIRSIRKIRKKS